MCISRVQSYLFEVFITPYKTPAYTLSVQRRISKTVRRYQTQHDCMLNYSGRHLMKSSSKPCGCTVRPCERSLCLTVLVEIVEANCNRVKLVRCSLEILIALMNFKYKKEFSPDKFISEVFCFVLLHLAGRYLHTHFL